jgi:hypothetical protein
MIREWRDEVRRERKKAKGEQAEEMIRRQWEEKLPETKAAMEKGEPMISFGWSGGYVHYPMSQLPPPSPQFQKGYYENLMRIAGICANHKVKLFFIFQPDLGYHRQHRLLSPEEEEAFAISTRVFSKDWHNTVKALYPVGIGAMQKAAADSGVPFYDFSLILLNAQRNGFGDTVHLNGYGNAYVADRIADIFKPLLTDRNI